MRQTANCLQPVYGIQRPFLRRFARTTIFVSVIASTWGFALPSALGQTPGNAEATEPSLFEIFAACQNGANNPPKQDSVCTPKRVAVLDFDSDGDIDVDDFDTFARCYHGPGEPIACENADDTTALLAIAPTTTSPLGTAPLAAEPLATPEGGTAMASSAGGLQLYYYRERTMDPVLGRFVQRDPLEYSDTMNLYQYVSSRPSRYRDPYGRQAVPIPVPAPGPVVPIPFFPLPNPSPGPTPGPLDPGPLFPTSCCTFPVSCQSWLSPITVPLGYEKPFMCNDCIKSKPKKKNCKKRITRGEGDMRHAKKHIDKGSEPVVPCRNLKQKLDYLKRCKYNDLLPQINKLKKFYDDHCRGQYDKFPK